MATMVVVKCKNCKQEFAARKADRARGWGKFCSKSCKACKQTRTTGYSGPRHHVDQRDHTDLPDDEAGTDGHHLWK